MPIGRAGPEWPLVGRAGMLELVRDVRNAPSVRSALITGPPGVGKSRLAAAATAQAANEGWSTLALRGSAGLGEVALGPFRTVLRIPRSSNLDDLAAAVERELLAMRSARGVLVLVDDGQELDDASAALLHQLIAAGTIASIITVRSGTRLPAALTELWKDGLAERIDLANLDLEESTELLVAALGGPLQDSSAKRLFQVTEGNPLYLREVVLSSLETGALQEDGDEWRWRGEWATGSRLQEIVAARFGRLEPDVSSALEFVALAGSLPIALLSRLSTLEALSELEERALVTLERSGNRLEAVIAHPLHAEVLKSSMPELRRRAMLRNLVEALQRTGSRRAADRVRIACWSYEAGMSVDPVTLALGTDASLFSVGHAITGRLHEIFPKSAPARGADAAAVPQDPEVAVRLAEAAYEASGAVAEGVALAGTLAWTGAIDRAEAILAEVATRAEEPDDRLRLALALAWIGFWRRFDVEAATRILGDAIEAGRGVASPGLLAEAVGQLAGVALNTAQPARALRLAEEAASLEGLELFQSVPGGPPAAAALVYLGRCAESIELVDRAVPVVRDAGAALEVAMLLFAKAGALARAGRLEESRELGEWLREIGLAGNSLDAVAVFGLRVAESLLRQGRASSASRIFLDSSGLLAERDVLGYRPWALAGLARARAMAGDEHAAATALEEARRLQPIRRHFDLTRHLAEIELQSLAGRIDRALLAAREAVEWAREAEMVVDEACLIDAWLRIEPSAPLAERLSELAGETDSEFVAALAAHGRAFVDRDPGALVAVAERFAAQTAWATAAEAAATAARLYDRRNEVGPGRAAARMAAAFAERCEGVRLSTFETLSGAVELTKREREVAVLAAAGHSSRAIAERMFLSPRTVENHLYHAYIKLGVTDRASLAEALDRRRQG
jgi:DNA-binding CsgD family transcriptional regulator/tetratricopeptide (TPR) repeat protein